MSQRSIIRERNLVRSPIIAALDIGTSKVTCMISRRSDVVDGQPTVLGAGAQATKSIRAGAVVDLDALERSIRLAVEQAERAAETRIEDIVIGISGPDLRSDIVRAKLPLAGREVTHQHVREVKQAALSSFSKSNRQILHSTLLGFAIDGASGVKNPVGMFADTLSASILIVSAPETGLKNLLQCVSRAHLIPLSVVASPFAAGLAVLVEDEIEQGAVVIDFGAGVTSAAAFSDGNLIHLETLAVGGARATSDLAQGIGTTFAAAERLKIQHGAVGLTEVSALDLVEAPVLGIDGRLESARCTRADIAHILGPRVEEIFELLEKRLSAASAAGRPLPRRIVLTGGSSQLPSLRELAEDIFQAPVRLAKPTNIRGLGETYSSPSFASAAGLLRSQVVGVPDAMKAGVGREDEASDGNLLVRVSGWLKENF